MRQRLLTSAVCAMCIWACGDDASSICRAGRCAGTDPSTGLPAGPNYAGSCNHEADAVCDEYAIDNATAATPGQCTSAGGVWATTQCPSVDRTGVCASTTPATRKFAYSEAAATSLMASCPMGKFTKIAGPATTGGAGGTSAPPMMMPDATVTTPDAMTSDAALDATAPDAGM